MSINEGSVFLFFVFCFVVVVFFGVFFGRVGGGGGGGFVFVWVVGGSGVSFTNIHRTAEKGGRYLFEKCLMGHKTKNYNIVF